LQPIATLLINAVGNQATLAPNPADQVCNPTCGAAGASVTIGPGLVAVTTDGNGHIYPSAPAPGLITANTWQAANGFKPCPLSDAPTIAVSMAACTNDATKGIAVQAVTLAGNRKLAFPTDIPGTVDQVAVQFLLTQDGVGGRTLTPAPGYSPPVFNLSTRPGAVDLVTCSYNRPLAFGACSVVPDIGGVDPTTIASLGTLQLYVDVSDPTTLYAGANCAGALASGNGATVGSVKEKSSHAACGNVTGTMTLTNDGTGHWYLAPGASSYIDFSSTEGAIAQNTGYVITLAGVQFGDSTAQSIFFASTNGSTNTRVSCGLDTWSSTGLTAKVRRLDTDAGQVQATGSTTGLVAAPVVVDCNMQYALHFVWEAFNGGPYTNNGSFDGNGDSSSGNTSNTASTTVHLGHDADAGVYLSSGSKIFFVAVWNGANAGGASQSAIFTWGCKKEGIAC
jgi:hypothetical protein